MNTFATDIKDLLEVNIDKAEQIIANKEIATFFLGRETCPYCRKFATKLAKVVAETGATVHFVNSEKPGQEKALADFRSTYNIPTVPGFVQVTDGDVQVRCDSSMPEAEIKAFMGK